ncbi:MAG: ABC transporter ATP-binding protein [Christensenellales bacterium]|jgi:ATP-binding cassette subfamily B protein
MIRKFISYYKPHRKVFYTDMLCAFLVACCDLIYPLIARNIINDYVPNRTMNLFAYAAGGLLLIYILKAGLNYYILYYGHVMGVRMQGDMRRDAFRRMQKFPFSFFDENKTGSIMSRIVNDLMDITELAHHGPEDLFLSAVMLVGSFAILCTVSIPLTLIIFSSIPLIILFAVKMRKQLMDAFLKTREEIAEVNANLENSIAGIRVSKAYTSAVHEESKFEMFNKRFIKARSGAYKAMGQFHSGMTFFMDALYLVVLVAGGIFFFNGTIDVGDFAMFLLYISTFLTPVRRLVGFFEQYQNGMTGFKRFEQLMAENEEPEDPDAIELEDVEGSIEFRDVSFQYETKPDDSFANFRIDGLSLKLDAGKTVALVGPSGGGKTTLCHLIPRFYEVQSGSIHIDGYDIARLTRQSLRKNIGIVAQDVFLFTGTIRENIAYGRLDATEDEIIDAAKKANIHDHIMTLEEGYDTYIGERGVKLSGGQKQRVSIARVFLKNPAILILDEATSALDNATEMLIQGALERLAAGRTTIIVAHRLSTIKNADEIIVINDEGVKERGTHEELLKENGIYAELYQYQFRD